MKSVAITLSAVLAMGVAAEASAAGFELVGVQDAGHYLVTLQIGSVADLQALMNSHPNYETDDPNTALDQAVRAAGFAFTYTGWAASPLIMGQQLTTADGGLESLGESAEMGQPFSFDFRYVQQGVLSDGYKLLSFALLAPQGPGQIDLLSVKLNPITGNLPANTLTSAQSLASFTINAVPEPSAYVLMVIGLAGLGLARRIRQG